MKTGAILILILTLFDRISSAIPSRNVILGVRFVSYKNHNGTIATGMCCDEPTKMAGSCTPDLCDTSFKFCAKSQGSSTCDVFPNQPTQTTYNNNSLDFGRMIGNGVKKSSSLFSIQIEFKIGNIDFTIDANEMSDTNGTEATEKIAEFSFVVDWLTPRFVKGGVFRRFVLNDTHAQLVVDVVSQCSKHYYTQNCSLYCKPDVTQYDCSDNGTKEYFSGHSGTSLTTPVLTNPTTTVSTKSASSMSMKLLTSTSTKTAPITTKSRSSALTRTTTDVATRDTTSGLATKNTTSGLATKNTTSGLAHKNTTSGLVTKDTTSRLAAKNATSGMVTKDTTSVLVTKDTTSGLATKNTTSGLNTNKLVNPGDGEDNDIAGLAAGLSVGLLFLFLLIAVGAYFIYRNKKRGQVTPEEKTHSSTENEVCGSEKNEDAPNNKSITLTQSVWDTDQKHTVISGQHLSEETALEN